MADLTPTGIPTLEAVLEAEGASPQTAIGIATGLRRRYAEPQRHYHTLGHINALLELARDQRELLRDAAAVSLAIWYHDAVYRPRKSGNEAASARLARAELQGFIAPVRLTIVERLILATARHEPPAGEPDAPAFLDFDLAILGAPRAEYDGYARAIRAEYRWVPAPLYRKRRALLLEGLLGRKRIYLTDLMRDRLEHRARDNLAAEIAALRSR